MNDPNPRAGQAHPDLGELEAWRKGESTADLAAHVQDCPACRASLQELAELETALSGAVVARVSVPPSVDAAVLDMIAERSRRIRESEPAPRLIRWPGWAAIAALVLIVLGLSFMSRLLNRRPLPRMARRHEIDLSRFAPGDIDHSGTVDIVDAYHMARRLKVKGVIPEGWDLNGDGRVDDRDVAVIAHRAVAVNREDS